jgi:hypothetical protein
VPHRKQLRQASPPRPSPRVQRRFQRGAAGPPVATTTGHGGQRPLVATGAVPSGRCGAPRNPPARIRSPCRDLQIAAITICSGNVARRGVARAAEGPSRGRALPASPRRRYHRTAAACQASAAAAGGGETCRERRRCNDGAAAAAARPRRVAPVH